MRQFLNKTVFVICTIIILNFTAFGQNVPSCDQIQLEKPNALLRGSEDYYLSWIRYGKPGQKALVSQKLLELEDKKNYEITKRLWECEKKSIVKSSLLLALFDQRPDEHLEAVRVLFRKNGDIWDIEDITIERLDDWTPEPYDVDIKNGWNRLWFSGKDNAALRLVGSGFADKKTFGHLLFLAANWANPSIRLEVKKRFDLFEGIPDYELGPKTTYRSTQIGGPMKMDKEAEKYNKVRKEQLKKIERWYSENQSKLRWNTSRSVYEIDTTK